MEKTFKVGDRVRVIDFNIGGLQEFIGKTGIIRRGPVGDTFKYAVGVKGMKPSYLKDGIWADVEATSEQSGLVKQTPPRFILQYELDTDPFELFATEKEVRARIKELAERSDLKRDSVKVYEIKNVRSVKLGTSIKFTK